MYKGLRPSYGGHAVPPLGNRFSAQKTRGLSSLESQDAPRRSRETPRRRRCARPAPRLPRCPRASWRRPRRPARISRPRSERRSMECHARQIRSAPTDRRTALARTAEVDMHVRLIALHDPIEARAGALRHAFAWPFGDANLGLGNEALHEHAVRERNQLLERRLARRAQQTPMAYASDNE